MYIFGFHPSYIQVTATHSHIKFTSPYNLQPDQLKILIKQSENC